MLKTNLIQSNPTHKHLYHILIFKKLEKCGQIFIGLPIFLVLILVNLNSIDKHDKLILSL